MAIRAYLDWNKRCLLVLAQEKGILRFDSHPTAEYWLFYFCYLFFSSVGIWYRMSRSVCFLYKGELTNGNVFTQEDMKSWVKIVAVEIDRNERE